MTKEICKKCGQLKEEHWELKDGFYCPIYKKEIDLNNKFEPQENCCEGENECINSQTFKNHNESEDEVGETPLQQMGVGSNPTASGSPKK